MRKRLFSSIQFLFYRRRQDPNSSTSVTGSPGIIGMAAVFLILVIFLLHLFKATGEVPCARPPLELPQARNCQELRQAPLVSLFDGRIMIEGNELESDEDIKEQLDNLAKNYRVLHPDQPALTRIIIEADRTVPFRQIRRVMAVSSAANYHEFQLAVVCAGYS